MHPGKRMHDGGLREFSMRKIRVISCWGKLKAKNSGRFHINDLNKFFCYQACIKNGYNNELFLSV